MKIKLTKVNIVGEKYFHIFTMDDGNTEFIETTEEDYKQLGMKNPNNPVIKNGKWLKSFSKRKLDTYSGDLKPNQYFQDGDSYVVMVDDSSVGCGIKLEDIFNDGIDETEVEKIKDDFVIFKNSK